VITVDSLFNTGCEIQAQAEAVRLATRPPPKLIDEGKSRQYVADFLNEGRVTLYRALKES
jgi:hypothetical protein